MESGQSKGNGSSQRDSAHDRLPYTEVIHQRDHVLAETGNRKMSGIAEF
jgi:hypothetical protein